jgi:hypothetical protein
MEWEKGPWLKIHPRHVPTERARRELANFLLEWRTRHALTEAEYLMLVAEPVASEAGGLVRHERAECPGCPECPE